ncbi:ABC transporter permease [Streptomyces sp. SS1-1]|uniref:ABC transporter permease n=1 Tax=Streptomyces sp. SS1-1 TaxID=2651869 RepID=UPI00124FB2FA|nr:ABC transporter permease [Streptomyces sp. SS1-1]KAB2976948.1 ABC transporter permease [Streptomyces sp. SS1-1]
MSSLLTMIGRCTRLTRRDVDALIMSLMLPIMMMVLFVYLFGGAIQTGGDYVTYVAPGVLLLCTVWGAAQTGVGVANDMSTGIVDRFRSMDVGGAAMLGGHVMASIIKNITSTFVVIGVALLIGFRPKADALQWLAAAGVLVAFILAMSWLAAVVGLLTKSTDAAASFAFVMMFLPYVSSAFVPIKTLPSWLQGVAEHQPSTAIIESVRGFLLDRPVGDHAWIGLVWSGGILLVSVVLAGVFFQRRAD